MSRFAAPNLLPSGQVMHRAWGRRIVDWAVAGRSHRVICLLCGVWTISGFDLVLTVCANHQGLLHESNPIAARILPFGPVALVVFKLVTVAFASTVMLVNRTRFLAEVSAAGVLVIYAIVAVQWRLCYELYMLIRSGNMSVREIDIISFRHLISGYGLF